MTRSEHERLVTLERGAETVQMRLERLEESLAAAPVSFAGPRRARPVPWVGEDASASGAVPPPQEHPTATSHTPARRPGAGTQAQRQPEVPVAAPRPPVRPAPASPAIDIEDLLGGRVLAWAGGLAMALGIVLLLAMAVSNGWIGETARVALAGLGSLALLAGGVRVHERKGRTDAALAACAAGIVGIFATVAVGGPGYGVLPPTAALGLALACGALATGLAVRWDSRGIAALGLTGALLAPALAGAPSTGATLVVVWIAGAAGAAVVVRQRWDWLAAAILVLALPQWLVVLLDDATLPGALALLIAFGALNVVAAVGFELRVPAARLRPSSALLLTANAVVLAVAGHFVLADLGSDSLAHAWLAALAAVHAAVGLGTASTRVNRDVRLLALAVGVVLADVALGLVLDGAALAGAWGAAAVAAGALARGVLRRGPAQRHDEALLGLGLGGHLLIASTHALLTAPPEQAAAGEAIALAGHAAVACAAVSAFVAGRFADTVRPQWRAALDTVALAGVAYLTAITLDGPLLTVAVAAEAVALAAIARRERDAVAAWGSAAFLGAALGHALVLDAPPEGLVSGLADPAGGTLALAAVAAAALWLTRSIRGVDARLATFAAGGAAATLLYLVSTQLVTGVAAGDVPSTGDVFALGSRQLAQALLSGTWALVGLAALVIGLARDVRPLRLGALALLVTTMAKVFLFDLAALESIYRVGSFVALGTLLLAAAFAWQRARPRPRADLRAMPPGLR